MLYAISGSQGTGKSTMLKHLKDLEFNTIERKTARSVLNDWNITLTDVYSDLEIMKKFQEELVIRKYEDEYKAYHDKDNIWFTERTFADLLAYTTIVLGPKNENADWLSTYLRICSTYQKKYDGIFYINHIPEIIENDGLRNHCSVFGRLVNYSIKGYTHYITDENKIIDIDIWNIRDRIDIVLQHIGR